MLINVALGAHQQVYRSADRAFAELCRKRTKNSPKMCLTCLEKRHCCIRSMLYMLYVLKPAKRADFRMIGGLTHCKLSGGSIQWLQS